MTNARERIKARCSQEKVLEILGRSSDKYPMGKSDGTWLTNESTMSDRMKSDMKNLKKE